jgi:hypothetical protein
LLPATSLRALEVTRAASGEAEHDLRRVLADDEQLPAGVDPDEADFLAPLAGLRDLLDRSPRRPHAEAAKRDREADTNLAKRRHEQAASMSRWPLWRLEQEPNADLRAEALRLREQAERERVAERVRFRQRVARSEVDGARLAYDAKAEFVAVESDDDA